MLIRTVKTSRIAKEKHATIQSNKPDYIVQKVPQKTSLSPLTPSNRHNWKSCPPQIVAVSINI